MEGGEEEESDGWKGRGGGRRKARDGGGGGGMEGERDGGGEGWRGRDGGGGGGGEGWRGRGRRKARDGGGEMEGEGWRGRDGGGGKTGSKGRREAMFAALSPHSAIVSKMAESEIDFMLQQLVATRDPRFLQFLSNLCVCNDRPIPSTQSMPPPPPHSPSSLIPSLLSCHFSSLPPSLPLPPPLPPPSPRCHSGQAGSCPRQVSVLSAGGGWLRPLPWGQGGCGLLSSTSCHQSPGLAPTAGNS